MLIYLGKSWEIKIAVKWSIYNNMKKNDINEKSVIIEQNCRLLRFVATRELSLLLSREQRNTRAHSHPRQQTDPQKHKHTHTDTDTHTLSLFLPQTDRFSEGEKKFPIKKLAKEKKCSSAD
jgi:hypothetical protein